MKRLLPFILILSQLACYIQSAIPTAISEPQILPTFQTKSELEKPLSTPNPTRGTVKITGDVYVRNFSGTVVGSLKAGQSVSAWCGLEVCYLGSETTIHRGCTDKAQERKCLTK